MLSVIDFCNMSFKDVSSLSEEVEIFSNQDIWLNRNVKKEFERPNVANVKQEILKDETKSNEQSKC